MKFEKVSLYPEAKLPERATAGSAGYDFYCLKDIVIYPHKIELIPTGVKCQLDKEHWLLIALRSSTPRKKNLMLANGIGIIDSDYYGAKDAEEGHIQFQVYNFSELPVVITKGEKIGQGVIVPCGLVDDDSATGDRIGGFGSTD